MIYMNGRLSNFQEFMKPENRFPRYVKPSRPHHRSKSTSWEEMSPQERIDYAAWLEAFSDLLLFSNITAQNPFVEDELTRGLRNVGPGKRIPLWLVFAAQFFLDAQHVLGEATQNAYADLRKGAQHIQNSIRESLEFHKNARVVDNLKQTIFELEDMTKMIDHWVIGDIVAEVWKFNVSCKVLVYF